MSVKSVFEAKSRASVVPEMIKQCIVDLPHENQEYIYQKKRRKNSKRTSLKTNEFYRMMNSVSLKNIDKWIPQISSILSQYNKEDIMLFCVDVIFNQPLHGKAYTILLSHFPNDFIRYFFDLCERGDINDSKKSIHKGSFFAHWILHNSKKHGNYDIPNLSNPKNDMAFSVSLIKSLYNYNGTLPDIPTISDFENKTKYVIENEFESLDLQTKMIAYDLLDVYEARS